jgi:hypothetical protein
MKSLQIFDPAMCCSTGVCGPSVDPKLLTLSANIGFLKNQGITVERFNLAHQPNAFTSNPLVLEEMGAEAEHLPLFIVGGKVCAKGTYPSRAELASWFGLDSGRTELTMASQPCCSSDDEACC